MLYRLFLVLLLTVITGAGCARPNIKPQEMSLTDTLLSIETSIQALKKQLSENRHGMYLSEATVNLSLSVSEQNKGTLSVDLTKAYAVAGVSGQSAFGGSYTYTNDQSKSNTIDLKFKSIFDLSADQLSAWNMLYVIDPKTCRDIGMGTNTSYRPTTEELQKNLGTQIAPTK